MLYCIYILYYISFDNEKFYILFFKVFHLDRMMVNILCAYTLNHSLSVDRKKLLSPSGIARKILRNKKSHLKTIKKSDLEIFSFKSLFQCRKNNKVRSLFISFLFTFSNESLLPPVKLAKIHPTLGG